MRSEPMPSSRTLLIDTLHSPSRQILHVASPSGRGVRFCHRRFRSSTDAGIVMRQVRSVKNKAPQDMGVWLQLWISCETPAELR
jgi:predicted transcriptional regulator